MKSDESKYKAVSLASQIVGDSTIILNHITGKIVTLNQSSAEILSLFKNPRYVSGVISLLKKKYLEVKEVDVMDTVKALCSEGLLIDLKNVKSKKILS